jgi:Icc-related predicted phosphoesterase
MTKIRFLFSTDFHGSETVWRKFLNAAKIFDLHALVLSGDMTGKVVVPIVKRADGKYDTAFLGNRYVLSEEEIPDFSKKCRMIAYIPYVTTPEEATVFETDKEKREKLFEKLEVEIVKTWLNLIPERVPTKCKIIISPGNDDKFAIDDVIRSCSRVTFGEEEVVRLDEEHEVACCGWVNPTPFHSPRECSEEELYQKLEATVSKVNDHKTAIFAFHCPPFGGVIDVAPQVDENLRQILIGGTPLTKPVGSSAVRKIIEKYQPLLGLHGHIHESPGSIKIGRTACLNPGSEYGEGIFKGFLVEIDRDQVMKLQRVEG